MKVYTFSQARQNLASVLDIAHKDGSVKVTRRDGRQFTIQPLKTTVSPLCVKGISLKIDRDELVDAVRESRERAG